MQLVISPVVLLHFLLIPDLAMALEYRGSGDSQYSFDRAWTECDRVIAGNLPGRIQEYLDRFEAELPTTQEAIENCDTVEYIESRTRLATIVAELNDEYRDQVQRQVAMNAAYQELYAGWLAHAPGQQRVPEEFQFLLGSELDGILVNEGVTAHLNAFLGALEHTNRPNLSPARQLAQRGCARFNPWIALAELIPNVVTLVFESIDAGVLYSSMDDLLHLEEMRLYYRAIILPIYRQHIDILRASVEEYDRIRDDHACTHEVCESDLDRYLREQQLEGEEREMRRWTEEHRIEYRPRPWHTD
ncbi:hypothetical protein BOW35_12500 [Solemya velum gill symbiont]|nr:hypothetical protein BOW27_10815 [Solemya velum gill symbiont]OOZ16085.1 hypothetical protein BOW28_11490 [Solemya velum gill symbiont]OOZ17798.1 hypothetical protein BOW29_10760 [Solemya velum gill symbiont]OOZ20984.1 hypothetical protein BOW30_11625 [Solemya velum gill symbiont]OOZ22096.1 hypothetical protein BOW31_11785 [Solemya velum gill symbiont]